MKEVQVYVIYDIEDDRIRNRVAEACKDFGLTRIQYSAFSGTLNRSKRGELFLRLSSLLGKSQGRILVLPVCEKDMKEAKEISTMEDEFLIF